MIYSITGKDTGFLIGDIYFPSSLCSKVILSDITSGNKLNGILKGNYLYTNSKKRYCSLSSLLYYYNIEIILKELKKYNLVLNTYIAFKVTSDFNYKRYKFGDSVSSFLNSDYSYVIFDTLRNKVIAFISLDRDIYSESKDIYLSYIESHEKGKGVGKSIISWLSGYFDTIHGLSTYISLNFWLKLADVDSSTCKFSINNKDKEIKNEV